MQNTTAVRIPRNVTPFFGLFAATIGTLFSVPLVLTSPVVGIPVLNNQMATRVPEQPVFTAFERAIDLMESGRATEAADILDAQHAQSWDITPDLETSAPVLLTSLARAIETTAGNEAAAGKMEEARQWVERLHMLADQALRTRTASTTSLQIAHLMERFANRTEASVWTRAGNPAQAARAMARRANLDRFWKTRIFPRMSACRYWDRSAPVAGSRQDQASITGTTSTDATATSDLRQLVHEMAMYLRHS